MSTKPGIDYLDNGKGLLIEQEIQGPPEKEPTEQELEIGDAIGQVFGQLLLRVANVPRTRRLIYALHRKGYTIEKMKE